MIMSIAASPQFRRSGIGDALMRSAHPMILTPSLTPTTGEEITSAVFPPTSAIVAAAVCYRSIRGRLFQATGFPAETGEIQERSTEGTVFVVGLNHNEARL
jgi:hypothetical protein